MTDYTSQPPPSTGPPTTSTAGQPPSPPPAHQGGLPITGSDLGGLALIGLGLALTGVAIRRVTRRGPRDPWASAERDRQREWDRLARSARAQGHTQYRITTDPNDNTPWRDLPE